MDETFDTKAFARAYAQEMNDATSDSIDCWETLDDLIERQPDVAWSVLVALSDIVSEQEASRLGSGPLEELIVAHSEFAAKAIALARSNAMFRVMLSYVDARGGSSGIAEAIRAAARGG
jgi:hypothetical protein